MKNKTSNLTYHDIKKATNLSIGTISRFFNNGSISQKAKIKIENYIQATNYQPNLGAKLIKGSENCIYLIICSLDDSSNMVIVNSIIEAFKKQAINVYLVVASYNPDHYLDVLKSTILRKPKTLILFLPTLNEDLKNFIDQIEITTYVFGNSLTNKTTISLDNQNYFFNLTKTIINTKQFNKIVYIGKDLDDWETGKLRLEGFKKAIKLKPLIESQVILIKANNFLELANDQELQEIIKNASKNVFIICGTHTIFEYLFLQQIKNNYQYQLSDIGYQSKYDYLHQTYQYKVFIDFYYIGYLIYKKIINCEEQNLLIKEKIIARQ